MGSRSCSGGVLKATPFSQCVGRGRSNAGVLHVVFRALEGCTAVLRATLRLSPTLGRTRELPFLVSLIMHWEFLVQSLAIED